MNKKLSLDIVKELKLLIPDPKCELDFTNNFELICAVMLSAQTTDKRVNMITEKLFEKYKTPFDFKDLDIEELEKYIMSCNYYHNKAKNIIKMCQILVDKYGGKVPSTHDELIGLPGVGNKTANVVQAVAFNQQALPVDTHVLRVSNRLGFVSTKDPTKCETSLKDIFNGYDLMEIHHLLLLFGRYHCMARNPKCDNCPLAKECEYKKEV